MSGRGGGTSVRARRREGRQLAALMAAAAVTNVAYTLLIPFVPFLAGDLGMSSFAIGVAFGGFALTKALFQPLGGLLADRLGAPRVAVAGLVATSAATLGLGLSASADGIVAWRLAWGVAEGLMVPALYQLCFSIRPGDGDFGGKVMGWFGSAAVLGMAGGPALVGVFYDELAFGTFFIVTAGVTLLAAALILASLRGARGAVTAADHEPAGPAPALRHSLLAAVAALGAADFLNNFLFAALEPTLPLHIDGALDGSPEAISAVFTAGLLVFALVAVPAGAIVARLGVGGTIALAFAVAAGGLAVQAAAGDVPLLAAGFLVFMATQPLVYVAARRGIARVETGRQGRAFGLLGAVSDLGYVAGPLAGTALLDASSPALFAALAGASLAAAALAGWVSAAPRHARAPARATARDRMKGAVS